MNVIEDSAPSIVHGASSIVYGASTQPLCKEAQDYVVLHLIHPMTFHSPLHLRCIRCKGLCTKGAKKLNDNEIFALHLRCTANRNGVEVHNL